MSGLQDAGDAREGRHRPQVRNLSPRVSDQGRHSGDVDRRGHGRALTTTAPPSRAQDPAGPAAPDRRCGLHHAARRRPQATLSRRSPHLSGGGGRSRWCGTTPTSTSSSTRAAAGLATAALRLAWPRLRGARLRCRDRPARRTRAAWLTRASGAPVRIGYACPGRAGLTPRVPWTPSLFHRAIRSLNQWDLLDAARDRAGRSGAAREHGARSGGGGARRRRSTTPVSPPTPGSS